MANDRENYDNAFWSAVNVTLPQDEQMHASSHRERQWQFDPPARLRLIDCVLPGLKDRDEAKRLEMGSDYCRFLENRLLQLREWRSWKKYAQGQSDSKVLKTKEEPRTSTSTVSIHSSPTSLIVPQQPVPMAAGTGVEGTDEESSEGDHSDSESTVPSQDQQATQPHSKIPPRLPPPLPAGPRPGAAPPTSSPVNESQQLSVPVQDVLEPTLTSSANPTMSIPNPVPEKEMNEHEVIPEKGEKSGEELPLEEGILTTTLIDAFVAVVSFFAKVSANQEATSVADFIAANTDFPPILVFEMLSLWLCLHSIGKPTVLSFVSEPALNVIDLMRILPRRVSFNDPSEPFAEQRSHNFGAAFSGDSLVLIGNVELVRTWDIASHLYFDRPNRRLYLFVTGGFCYSQNHCCDEFSVSYKAHWRLPAGDHMRPEVQAITPIPLKYTQEVSRTLTLLFDQSSKGRKIFREFQKPFRDLKPLLPPMRLRNRKLGAVWTEEGKHSLPNQYRTANIRALVRSTYHLEDFPYFAERLLILEAYLKEVQPSNFRTLMRDSRDQLQYYTFVVAIVVFGLTAAGLILSILQTIASFMQVSLALQQSGG